METEMKMKFDVRNGRKVTGLVTSCIGTAF